MKSQPPIVIKISPAKENLIKEVSVVKNCRKMQKKLCGEDAKGPLPHIGAHGKFSINNSTDKKSEFMDLEFFIQKRYNQTLEEFMLDSNKKNNSVTNVLSIVNQLVKCFEIIHKCNVTYNDLKPENIMITNSQANQVRVNLIDFGFAEPCLNPDGSLIHEDDEVEVFRGNMLFASTR